MQPGGFDALDWPAPDEVGRLARSLNEAAGALRRDIDRLSGLYHISLMMGTGTGFSKICKIYWQENRFCEKLTQTDGLHPMPKGSKASWDASRIPTAFSLVEQINAH